MKKLNPLVSDDSVLSILEISRAYQKSKILLTACELDIFSVLGNEEKTSREVAFEIDTDERATDRIMNALCSIKLLNKRGYLFSNSKGTFRFLVKGQPEFIGNMMHQSNLWHAWGTLTDAVKKGTALYNKDLNEKSDYWIRSYIDSIHWRAQMQAPDIIDYLDLSGVNKILDLGGGSGIYSMEFLKSNPGIKCVVFDLPRVAELTLELFEREGFSGRVEAIGGDVLHDDFGSGYDMIFISMLLTEFSIWENITIIKKCFDALRMGGRVVIHETLIDDDRTSPENAAIMSLNMLVNTKAGDAHTETDLWVTLKEAWFKNIRKIKTEFGSSLIIGEK